MKYLITVLSISCILLLGYSRQGLVDTKKRQIDVKELAATIAEKKMSVIRCTPDWTNYSLSTEEIQQMIPLPGTGSHKWQISTNSDSAQFYFNQGINLYYGFHILEALPSFKKAQLFDSSCGMLYWAEALAYGPNINDLGYAASPQALAASGKAVDLLRNTSSTEAGLIKAMAARYSNDTLLLREDLNQQYADKMKELHVKFPTDPEIGALYADALMVQHPWDLWENNGTPKPWTPEIEKVLQKLLQTTPDHPGAMHYYIHTVEASPNPGKANAAADRLGKLLPGLSHAVHMPSHIYIRTGNYAKGIAVNKEAAKQYETFKTLYPDVTNNPFLYDIHNRHLQASCALNIDDYASAVKYAIACRSSMDTSLLSLEAPSGDYMQYVYMMPN